LSNFYDLMNVPIAHYNAFNTVTYVLDSIGLMAEHMQLVS